MRDNWLSNRVFESYDEIVDQCCDAWNKLVDQPWRIMSIGLDDGPWVMINRNGISRVARGGQAERKHENSCSGGHSKKSRHVSSPDRLDRICNLTIGVEI